MRILACLPAMAALLLTTLLSAGLEAQSSLIAVIKPNRSAAPNHTLGVPFDGKFDATNVSVAELVAAAYGGYLPLDPQHMAGLPPWAMSDRFDVAVRDDAAEPTEDREDDSAIFAAFAMVRTVLAERFGLRTHVTTRRAAVHCSPITRCGRQTRACGNRWRVRDTSSERTRTREAYTLTFSACSMIPGR